MKRTNRGFAIYEEFVDTYRNSVRVQRSSRAGEPCVWIYCEPAEGSQFKSYDDAPSPHLTAEQARLVAKALLEFADGVE